MTKGVAGPGTAMGVRTNGALDSVNRFDRARSTIASRYNRQPPLGTPFLRHTYSDTVCWFNSLVMGSNHFSEVDMSAGVVSVG